MGQPLVTQENCWDIYLQLLSGFLKLDQMHTINKGFDSRWRYTLVMAEHNYKNNKMELLPGLQDLNAIDEYLGGMGACWQLLPAFMCQLTQNIGQLLHNHSRIKICKVFNWTGTCRAAEGVGCPGDKLSECQG
ncbi:unnamed protein product [Mycena citricolor]|uniref:Uncharacterized protein n=1 Tax=Mycena citricolor TaxID=2018698 RepID=A0AAD2H406_9AGAR|nr:unnamed protein product [Mycena citricolor]